MQVLHAAKEQLEKIRALILQSFPQIKQDNVDRMLAPSLLRQVYVLTQQQHIYSVLLTRPVTFQGRKGVYLHTIATEEQSRGKGCMTELLSFFGREARQQGIEFEIAALQNPSLSLFYSARGFDTRLVLQKAQTIIRPNLMAQAECDTMTARRFVQLREKYAGDRFVQFTDEDYQALFSALYASEGTTIETEHAYGIFLRRDADLQFLELFARSERDAEYLLQAARNATGRFSAEICMDAYCGLYVGEGHAEPCALVRCDENLKSAFREAYFNLLL